MNKAFIKKYGSLLLLAASAGIIYQLPYIRETFYTPLQQGMGLSNTQMGMLNSGYSTIAIWAFMVGGLVADRFSARKLLTISLVSTGALGMWFASFPGYGVCRMIFTLMGVSTVVTFWSAMLKATRMLGDSSEQGRLFGLQEGLRGFMNAALVFVMMGAYNAFADQVIGTQWAVRTCAITDIILGVLCWFVLDDTVPEEQATTLKDTLLGMWDVCKMPRAWVMSVICFAVYSIYGLLGYINTYLINVYGASTQLGITLGGVRYVIQGLGGVLGAVLSEKVGKVKVILTCAILEIVCFAGFLVLPASAQMIPVVVANFLVGLLLIYISRSLYYAVVDDANISVKKTGRVTGLMSFIGQSPDVFTFVLVGSWLDKYSGKAGYDRMFIYTIAMGVLCVIFTLIFARIIKKDKERGITEKF